MKNKLTIFGILIITLALVFMGCEDRSDLTAPKAPNTGSADFSSFVAIGNSLTAGLQNGALYREAQENSFPKMIADRVETKFVQPYMGGDGTGSKIEISALDTFTTTQQEPHTQQPVNIATYMKPYNNLGIPNSILLDVVDTTEFQAKSEARENPFFAFILRNQQFGKSVLEQAMNLQPSFATLWIGNNDVLGYATSGGTEGTDLASGTMPTTQQTFQQYFTTIGGALVQAGAKVAVANIPDVTAIPFFTTVGPGIGAIMQELQQLNPQIQGLYYQKKGETAVAPTQFASPTDLLNLNVLITLPGSAFANMVGDTTGAFYAAQGMTPPQGIDVSQPFGLHPQNPWPHSLTLDPDEITTISDAISGYNSVIAGFANSSDNVVLVDINQELNQIPRSQQASEYYVDGLKMSSQYVQGGIFSLDGVHPTSRGYAIIANKFINAINQGFGASISRINVATVEGSLPLAKGSILDKYGLPKAAPGTFKGVLK
jgi:lysophospholipase L1-like esterase